MRLTDSLDTAVLETLKAYGKQDIGFVFQITCLHNKRCYVGQTSGFWFQFVPNVRRFKEHRNKLTSGVHNSYLLQQDWKLYGEVNFAVEIIEVVALPFRHNSLQPNQKSMLFLREKHWQIWSANAIYSQSRHSNSARKPDLTKEIKFS